MDVQRALGDVVLIVAHEQPPDQQDKSQYSIDDSFDRTHSCGSADTPDRTLPRTPWTNCRIVGAFVSMMDSINSWPVESRTAAEIVA